MTSGDAGRALAPCSCAWSACSAARSTSSARAWATCPKSGPVERFTERFRTGHQGIVRRAHDSELVRSMDEIDQGQFVTISMVYSNQR